MYINIAKRYYKKNFLNKPYKIKKKFFKNLI